MMNKRHNIAVFCLIVFSLLVAAGAVAQAFLIPDASSLKKITAGFIAVLSCGLLATVAVFRKTLNTLTAQLEFIKTQDPLTDLCNRKTFWYFLRHEIARAKRQHYRFAVIIADIDNFKAINDIYGTDAGDSCLREFSRLFKLSVRGGDIAARYGGDKFAALLPVCDEAQSCLVASRFLDGLRSRSFAVPDNAALQITASIGIAVYPDHAADEEGLFQVAHAMLQQAKLLGKDRMRRPSDEADIKAMKSAGESYLFIMDAIRKKQIVPYFQPIVSTKDRTLLAYEVLTRIVTPDRIISAEEFIEAAEGIGAIGKIDCQLMEQAFTIMKSSGYEGLLFFNLSPKALVIPEFMPQLRRLMNAYGIRPAQMVFEITERDTVKNLGLIERTIQELKKDGFKFAIDDFGKGYSSFNYIKLFKVDFLKIDGDFIRNMTSHDCIEHVIVKNITDLAAVLGITTIAEYVESKTVFDNVRSAGIHFAQGFHIMRPRHDLDLPPSFFPGRESALLA